MEPKIVYYSRLYIKDKLSSYPIITDVIIEKFLKAIRKYVRTKAKTDILIYDPEHCNQIHYFDEALKKFISIDYSNPDVLHILFPRYPKTKQVAAHALLMTSGFLLNKDSKEEYEKIRLMKEQKGEEEPTVEYEACRKCGFIENIIRIVQTSAVDESPTIFITCRHCGLKWKH